MRAFISPIPAKVRCHSIFVLVLVAEKQHLVCFSESNSVKGNKDVRGCTQDNSQSGQRAESTDRSHDADVSGRRIEPTQTAASGEEPEEELKAASRRVHAIFNMLSKC